VTGHQELFSLAGKRVLVTGASGHLGSALVRWLVADGAYVYLLDRELGQLSVVANGLEETGLHQVTLFSVDLEKRQAREDFAKQLKGAAPHLDGIVHNAAFVGTSAGKGWSTSFEQQTLEPWARSLEVNLTAPFHLTQLLLPLLKKSPAPSLVSIGSIYGILGPDWGLYNGMEMGNPAGYAAAKGGMIQLTRWLATTLAPHVRANSVSPGGIERLQPEEFVDAYVAKTPLGRMASEQDIVGAIVFLLSDASAYVTGQNLIVDGGFSVW
jgi:NAD(P)-dependent dehydrogenase (short-subunit alcohol dehydrogenase family)